MKDLKINYGFETIKIGNETAFAITTPHLQGMDLVSKTLVGIYEDIDKKVIENMPDEVLFRLQVMIANEIQRRKNEN